MFVIKLLLVLYSSCGYLCQGIPGRFLGYSAEYLILTPRSELSSYEMTLSKCLDVCGLLYKQPGVAAIRYDFCMCGNRFNVTNLKQSCKPLLNCRANVSEPCGCEAAFAYYATDYKGQCQLTITTGNSVQAITSSEVTIQLMGEWECAEGKTILNKNGRWGPVTSNCRELGPIERLRLGLVNPVDAWNLVEAFVYVPEHKPHNYSFHFENWLGQETSLGQTYGQNYSVVELFPNGTFVYPEIEGGRLYKNLTSQILTAPFICSINSDCQQKLTFIHFQRYYYSKTVILRNLLYLNKSGCSIPNYIPPDVLHNLPSGETEVNPGFKATFACDNNGKFLNTETPEFTSLCSDYGVWSEDLYLECTRDCSNGLPNAEDIRSNATTKMNSQPQKPGTAVSYACDNDTVFRGTQLANVTIYCQTDGTWSATKLPPCIIDTSSQPRYMRTSNLYPFSTRG